MVMVITPINDATSVLFHESTGRVCTAIRAVGARNLLTFWAPGRPGFVCGRLPFLQWMHFPKRRRLQDVLASSSGSQGSADWFRCQGWMQCLADTLWNSPGAKMLLVLLVRPLEGNTCETAWVAMLTGASVVSALAYYIYYNYKHLTVYVYRRHWCLTVNQCW